MSGVKVIAFFMFFVCAIAFIIASLLCTKAFVRGEQEKTNEAGNKKNDNRGPKDFIHSLIVILLIEAGLIADFFRLVALLDYPVTLLNVAATVLNLLVVIMVELLFLAALDLKEKSGQNTYSQTQSGEWIFAAYSGVFLVTSYNCYHLLLGLL